MKNKLCQVTKNIKWQKYFLNIEIERKRKEIKT